MKEIYRKQIYDARCNIKLLEKDFNFKLGYKLTKSEYDEVFNNGLQVKICSPSLDEVFFGSLYRNEDITAFKELDQEKIIYFVALNTTICGCLCGTVYSARINDQYALKMDK